MSFYEEYCKFKDFKFKEFFENISESDILRIINKEEIDKYEFLALLSPKAENFLEQMAQRAQQLTLQNFGKSITLFTPMYLANYCENKCAYCSFNTRNHIIRKKMSMKEIEEEAKYIVKQGIKHILILTGGSRKMTPVSYMVDAVKVLIKYFDSVSVEVYALTEEEYKQLVEAGVDGFTMFQEVYNEDIYKKVHLGGPKRNYRFRLDAPERACKARMRNVNIGALLGLDDWRKEAFFTGIHAEYLQDNYSDVDIAVSLPRIRPHIGVFNDVHEVNDKNMLQIMFALRMLMPKLGITISTRESEYFRDNIIPLSITKISADSSTKVGGHTSKDEEDSQFEIADTRNVEEVKQAILSKGYQPIFKDWMKI